MFTELREWPRVETVLLKHLLSLLMKQTKRYTDRHTAASESHGAPTLPSELKSRWNWFTLLTHNPPLLFPSPYNRCVTWRSLRRAATRPCRGCATSPRTEVRSRLGGWLCTVPRCAVIGQQLGNAVQYGGNGPCSDAVPWKGDTM